MGGEGPLEKNRPSPKLLGTFPIFMRDLHQFLARPSPQYLVSSLSAPNGPSDVPSRAFSASFAPDGTSDGPLRAFIRHPFAAIGSEQYQRDLGGGRVAG